MKVQHLQHLPAAAYGCNEGDLVAIIESRRIELHERAGWHPRRIVSAQGNNLE
jgi:aspartate 1-decarboxylase